MNSNYLGDSDDSSIYQSPHRNTSSSRRRSNRLECARNSAHVKGAAPVKSAAARRKKNTPVKRVKALLEIRNMQKTTNLLIPKLPFARLVREITLDFNEEVTRYTLLALQALQEATEIYITQVLHDAYYLTVHRHRITLSKGDIMLLRYLKLNI